MMTSLFTFLENKLPSLSPTEQIAIEAGDVWWEGELFSGNPDWKFLTTLPKPTLTADEKNFIDNQLSTLCQMIDDWEIFNTKRIPDLIWAYLKQEKFFGLVIPKAHGGHEFSAFAHSTIVATIASKSLSVAVTMMVPNSLGPGELLVHYGTDLQKDTYLPKLARGEMIPCFALTGEDAGSDASRMTDKGVVCYGEFEGKTTLGISLHFEKRYITLGPVSDLLGLAFKLYDPEKLLGNKEDVGITLALIPLPYPGVETHKKHDPLGLVFPNGAIRGKNVFIPIDWIIGGREKAGQGWRMLMECLSIGRSISLPALSTGISQLCAKTTGIYASRRVQFKQPIGYFEGIQEKLAVIGGLTYLIEAARRFTTIPVDLNKRPAIASAIAKYHLTEFARIVINHAMDIHGGKAIQMGPRNYLATSYIGMPVSITVEGANILTRNLIIFGQGALRCHPYLRKEMQAILHKDKKTFRELLIKHIGFTLKNFGRLFYKTKLDRLSAALSFCTDISLLILGGELKRKENVSARLGDVLSYLYLASAVKKHHAADDKIFVEWCMAYLLHQSQEALSDLCYNYPKKWVGRILHFIIFPLGKNYRRPSDQLNQAIAKILLSPNALRDKISSCFYPIPDLDTLDIIKVDEFD